MKKNRYLNFYNFFNDNLKFCGIKFKTFWCFLGILSVIERKRRLTTLAGWRPRKRCRLQDGGLGKVARLQDGGLVNSGDLIGVNGRYDACPGNL